MDRPPVLDAAALSAAYREHAAELFGYCLARTGDRQDAQDVVQETYLRVWRAADRYDPTLAGLRTWLYAVARNVLVDHLRRRASGIGPVTVVDDITGLVDGASQAAAHDRLDAIVVAQALRALSEDHRQVVVEIYLRDRPAAEVADALGIPHGTARSRLFHALRALRAELDRIGGLS